MKKTIFIAALLFIISSQTSESLGQKRPVKRPAAPVSKTTSTKEAEPAAVKKPEPATPAQAFFNEGLKCEAKDFDCRISNYTKAINLDLKTKDVFKNRGNAYLQRKDFDKAIADFTKLIELDLNDASGYKNRGRIFLENSNSPQAVNAAIRDFTSAIDLEPKDVESYNLRASTYKILGNINKAEADLEKALSLEPNNPDAQMSRVIGLKPEKSEAYLYRGISDVNQKKPDLALRDLTKTLELDSKNILAYRYRAEIFESNKKFDEALSDYRKIVELEPTNFYYFYKIASIFAEKKNEREALSNLDKSIDLDLINAQALEARCIINFQSARYKDANEHCSKARLLYWAISR